MPHSVLYNKDILGVDIKEDGTITLTHRHPPECMNKVMLKSCATFFKTMSQDERLSPFHKAVLASAVAEDEAKLENITNCCNIL